LCFNVTGSGDVERNSEGLYSPAQRETGDASAVLLLRQQQVINVSRGMAQRAVLHMQHIKTN
jgi:hypothetical protein